MNIATLLAEVVRIAPSLHKAGTFSPTTFEAFVRHATERPIAHSAETGAGASTLLCSHLSEHHTVFAVDAGTGSVRSIQDHPLLRKERVTFVEGPTQMTLPAHTFSQKLQLALIDGPHGYPFPDLEYFYLYPHLDSDALLIVDDIHIPTITNLFEFLSADEMFDLKEVIGSTAFFRRTTAPTFPPFEDGWWTQRYNQRAFESTAPELWEEPLPERVDVQTPFHLDRLGLILDPAQATRLELPCDEELLVSGWALDARRHRPASAIVLVLDGVAYRTPVRVPRPDVSVAYRDHTYLRCGFSATFPKNAVPRGSHELEIRIVLSGEREYFSAGHLRFAAG
jgi:Methyltransferase domain